MYPVSVPYIWGEMPQTGQSNPRHRAKLAVPMFHVTDMEASLRFYVDGLGFALTNGWRPEGRLRWCWLELDTVAIMLQQYWRNGGPGGAPEGPLSQGASICVFCEDACAIYRDLVARGIEATRPIVGNGLWVTSVTDPDGYRLDFESPTHDPEETVFDG